MIQQLNRKQNKNTIWTGNTHTMALMSLFTDEDKAFWIFTTTSGGSIATNILPGPVRRMAGCICIKFQRWEKMSTITQGDFDVVSIIALIRKGICLLHCFAGKLYATLSVPE